MRSHRSVPLISIGSTRCRSNSHALFRLIEVNGAAAADLTLISFPCTGARVMNAISRRCRLACAAFLLVATAVQAEPEPAALVDQHHCMFCHTRDAPFLAPSFEQLAARYRDVPNAQFM